VRVEEACGAAVTTRASMSSSSSSVDRIEPVADVFALVVTAGESPDRRIVLGPAPIVIGRGIGVDLPIRDPTVSRHHCVVWCIAGRCWVRDLGSTNPTRVNNRRSLVCEIVAGDVLVIGQTTLTLKRIRSAEIGPSRP
jgi:pSer/pThr/pTyr-binding forkhead associated (FHA) protein